jgi:4-amino-4-deoxy-L-arabinose transferase-like glycosyltransferase
VTGLSGFIRRHRAVLTVLAIGFLLRMAWFAHARPDPVSDYWVYYRMGENILDEGFIGVEGPSALLMPAHPVLLAGLMLVSRATWWLSLAMVVLSTAATLLVYLLARRLTGHEAVAVVASAVYALGPTHVLYAPVLGTEHLFVVLVLGALLVAFRVDEHAPGSAVGVGVLSGLALLTRGEMTFYVPIVLVLVWLGVGGAATVTKWRFVALFVGALTLVVAPWLIRNTVVIGPDVGLSTVSGMNFWFGHRPGGYGFTEDVPWPRGDEVTANRVGWELGIAHVRERPVSVLVSIREGTTRLFDAPEYALISSTQQAIPGEPLEWNRRHVRFAGTLGTILHSTAAVSLSLALVSLLTLPMWGRGLRLVVVGFLMVNWLGHAVLFFGHPRFRYTLDVLLTIPVAIALVALWNAPDRQASPVAKE